MSILTELIGLFFICFGIVIAGGNKDTLKGVVVLFRHGDRNPTYSWPNDKHYGNMSLWPEGYGELVNKGKQRHFELGQWFRERYNGFLPLKYNSKDIYVRSTDFDRTLMSAASNLAGLYPPENSQMWNKDIKWQPIPIHTVEKDIDAVLSPLYVCPKLTTLWQNLKNSKEIQSVMHEYRYVLEDIALEAGYKEIELEDIAQMYTTLIIYRERNLDLPLWAEVYWREIETLAAIQYKVTSWNSDIARLSSGPFFWFLRDHFGQIQFQNNPGMNYKPPKFLMLSAHDGTIADRTNAMGVYQDSVPEFASVVIWEVKSHNGSDDDLYLNLYFKNSTHLVPLTVPGCSFDCSLDDYNNIIEPFTTTEEGLMEECFEI